MKTIDVELVIEEMRLSKRRMRRAGVEPSVIYVCPQLFYALRKPDQLLNLIVVCDNLMALSWMIQ